jgi:hypothetical protein
MKIIKNGTMPDGTAIQIEDWSENYSCFAYADTITAYPIAKYTDTYSQFSPQAGKIFRAEFRFESYEVAKPIFENLVSGAIVLDSLRKYMTEPRYRKCLTGNPED